MLSIFRPLDPNEPPAAGGGTGFRAQNNLTSPLAPGADDALWKTLLTWLWLPALALFLTLEDWLRIPQFIAWLLAIGFIAVYAGLGWIAYRKRRR